MKHEMWVKVTYFCLDADLPSQMHLFTSLQDPTTYSCRDMSVDGNADADAHMDAEGTPINFLNVVEAN
jgi:hypothetical protein